LRKRDRREETRDKHERKQSAARRKKGRHEKRQSVARRKKGRHEKARGEREKRHKGECNPQRYLVFLIDATSLCLKQSESRLTRP
jgi:hypothetical protein